MIWFLRILFSVVLGSMLGVTSWASLQGSLFAIPHAVATHPWFIATLFDTYWAFFTFFVWLAYKETSWLARALWLVAIVLLGNIAMSTYCLILLWRVPVDTPFEQVLLRGNRPVAWWVPAGLIAAILGLGLVA
jgi:predicted permease